MHFLLMKFLLRLTVSSVISSEKLIRMVRLLMFLLARRFQSRRDAKAVKRSFSRMIKKHKAEPREIVTDKLKNYGVAHHELSGRLALEQFVTRRSMLSVVLI